MWRHSGRLTAEELRAILDLRAAPYAAALMAAELARQRSGVDPPAGTQAIRRRAEPVPLPRRRRQRGMFLVEAAAHLASVPAIDPRFAAAVAVAANRGIFYSRGGIPTSFASIIGRFEREYDQADRLVDEITHGGTTIEARGGRPSPSWRPSIARWRRPTPRRRRCSWRPSARASVGVGDVGGQQGGIDGRSHGAWHGDGKWCGAATYERTGELEPVLRRQVGSEFGSVGLDSDSGSWDVIPGVRSLLR